MKSTHGVKDRKRTLPLRSRSVLVAAAANTLLLRVHSLKANGTTPTRVSHMRTPRRAKRTSRRRARHGSRTKIRRGKRVRRRKNVPSANMNPITGGTRRDEGYRPSPVSRGVMIPPSGNVIAPAIGAPTIPILIVAARGGSHLIETAVARLATPRILQRIPGRVVGSTARSAPHLETVKILRLRIRAKEAVRAPNHPTRPRIDGVLRPGMTGGAPLPRTTDAMIGALLLPVHRGTRNVHVSVLTLLMNMYKYVST